jgi:hypothetical protein
MYESVDQGGSTVHPNSKYADEITAITDPVRLQQLQLIWTREVYRRVDAIHTWIRVLGVLALLGILAGFFAHA